MDEPELNLFVIWPKARFAEKRIFEDLRRETEVVWTGELCFEGDMKLAYRRFYGPSLPDARRKVANCGSGPFAVAVVRDPSPRYETVDAGGRKPVCCNVRMLALKTKYREWAGRKHRVHGTVASFEFARDVEMLTGHSANEWMRGVPAGAMRQHLPDGWVAVSSLDPFASGRIAPVWGDGAVESPRLESREQFRGETLLNNGLCRGAFLGVDAVEKRSSKAVWSIGNEYKVAARMHGAAPNLVPRPLAWRFAADGSWAAVVAERVKGPALAELLGRGILARDADSFAADILSLADALDKAGVVHRNLDAGTLALGADGHLKAIAWQMAIERASYCEDPWVARRWGIWHDAVGGGRVWNDFRSLWSLLAAFPQTDFVKSVRLSLAKRMEDMSFIPPKRPLERARMAIYAISRRLRAAIGK